MRLVAHLRRDKGTEASPLAKVLSSGKLFQNFNPNANAVKRILELVSTKRRGRSEQSKFFSLFSNLNSVLLTVYFARAIWPQRILHERRAKMPPS